MVNDVGSRQGMVWKRDGLPVGAVPHFVQAKITSQTDPLPVNPAARSLCSDLDVTPRQAVGQWTTPENVVARPAEAFSAAAEQEPDPERRGKLRAVASALVVPR